MPQQLKKYIIQLIYTFEEMPSKPHITYVNTLFFSPNKMGFNTIYKWIEQFNSQMLHNPSSTAVHIAVRQQC